MVNRIEAAIPREWLIFFSNSEHPIARLLPVGFQHVSAAAWYGRADRWVFYLPTAKGTAIEVRSTNDGGLRLQQMIDDAGAILRVVSRTDRTVAPIGGWCVGQIKALLGIRCRALSPRGLYRHLVRTGAEKVEVQREFLQGGFSCGESRDESHARG